MDKVYNWIIDKTNKIKENCHQTYNQISLAVKTVYAYSPPLKPYVDGYFRGVGRMFDVNNLTRLFSYKNTPVVMWRIVNVNLLQYMTMVLFYETAKRAMNEVVDLEHSELEYKLDMIATWYFFRLSARTMIDTVIYYQCLQKSLADENPVHPFFLDNKHTKEFLPNRKVQIKTKKIQGQVASVIYYYSNLGVSYLVWLVSPTAGNLVLALAYGLAFLEAPLSDMCTKHRLEILLKNIPEAFGFGSMFLLANEGMRYGVWRATKVENGYVDLAIFNFLYGYFLMLALLNDKPYVGKEEGIDVFYYGRQIAESIMQKSSELGSTILRNPGTQNIWHPLVDFLNNTPSLYYVKKLFLYDDFHDKQSLLRSPAIRLFWILNGKEIKGYLDWLEQMRKWPVTIMFAKVSGFLPAFIVSPKLDELLQFILQERLDDIIKILKDLVNEADEALIDVKPNDQPSLRTYFKNNLFEDVDFETFLPENSNKIKIEETNSDYRKLQSSDDKLSSDNKKIKNEENPIVKPKKNVARYVPKQKLSQDKVLNHSNETQQNSNSNSIISLTSNKLTDIIINEYEGTGRKEGEDEKWSSWELIENKEEEEWVDVKRGKVPRDTVGFFPRKNAALKTEQFEVIPDEKRLTN